MFINELVSEDVVSVDVVGENDKRVMLETTVLSNFTYADLDKLEIYKGQLKSDRFTIANVMLHDDAVLIFTEQAIKCSVTATHNNKVFKWDRVFIFKVKLPSIGSCHLIFAPDDVEAFNRRNEYRLSLVTDALVKIGDNTAPKDIVLRDLSIHGCGFTIDDKYDIPVGTRVVIQFRISEYSKAKQEPIYTMYTVPCRVVRIVPSSNNLKHIGCLITVDDDSIRKLISKEQVRRAKG